MAIGLDSTDILITLSVYVVLALTTIYHVFKKEKNELVKLVWAIFIVFIPFISSLLYLLKINFNLKMKRT